MTSLADPPAARPAVLDLHDPDATDHGLTGAKAAALARAASLGLPVLPGFVVTTAVVDDLDAAIGDDVRAAWGRLSSRGEVPLVVRSSSTAEDLEGGSMAGRYESVVDVRGWKAFVEAVRTVIASRTTAAKGSDVLTGEEPLAVLVQPLLDADAGGVLFGVDPVTGRSDRLVVAVSHRGANAVVSGEVTPTQYMLTRDGEVAEVDEQPDGATLSRHQCRTLAELAATAARAFGSHQDIEWAWSGDGVVLLQSRPVTTEVVGTPTGPVFGRGPVAESFPEPLAPLEEDLWVPPLREALGHALKLAGAATERDLEGTPLAIAVRGHVGVDLDITGEAQRAGLRRRLDPRRKVRRLLTAWRSGRLRAALPGLGEDVVHRCDDALATVPALDALSDVQLLGMLTRTQPALVSVHAHEILIGQLVDPGAPRLTGTSVALRVLAHARATGTPEAEIPWRHPVVLTLAPPRIGPLSLPARVEPPPWDGDRERARDAVLREALRLRVRWLQELMARAAWTLGERLVERGVLEDAGDVRWLRLDELQRAVDDSEVPDDLGARRDAPMTEVPPRFRLTEDGQPVAVTTGEQCCGTGAGGGRGRGRVVHRPEAAGHGDVLVMPTLDASLAPILPTLGGLVAETGSVLAHIAILAREAGVPIVVGASGAVDRYPEGSVVQVDGEDGDVQLVEDG